MTYYDKYIKYKNKYLILKGGVNGAVIKRVNSEMKKLTEELNTANLKFEGKELTFIYQENEYKFEIPDYFPRKEPIFYKNNIKIKLINDWTIESMIYNLVNDEIKRNMNEFKILIFCHPKIVSGTIDEIKGHFLSEDISILCKEAGIIETPTFDTIDIIEGGTYQGDGFSDEFVNKNVEKYNLVFVPDCGGLWYELQLNDKYENNQLIYSFRPKDKENNLSILIDNIIKISKLVKINGIISFSKIFVNEACKVKGIDFLNFTNAIIHFLKNNFESNELTTSNVKLIVSKKISNNY